MSYSPPPPVPMSYAPQPPRETRTGIALAWAVVIVSTGFLVWVNWHRSASPPAVRASAADIPSTALELASRYAVGAKQIITATGGKQPGTFENMLPQLENSAVTQLDQLRFVSVAGELAGAKAALERLDKLEPKLTVDRQKRDAVLLRRIYDRGAPSLSRPQRQALIDRHGWFGRLAVGFGQPDTDPNRASALAAARRTFIVLVSVISLTLFAGVIGFILLILTLVRLGDGRFWRAYRPIPNKRGPFLEAFAFYVGGFALISALAYFVAPTLRQHIALYITLALGPTILAIFWPLIRGVDVGIWRYALGFHAGRGLFREVGCGLVGYIAGLPVLGLGLIVTLVLTRVSNAHPSHPIINEVGHGLGPTILAFALASIYAPLTEETMFRGAFFHYLRGRWAWIISAVVSGFVFAAVHPQGWTVVPALMSIAIVLAGIREWRGTMLASATAHALHNTMLLLMLLVSAT